MSTMRLRLLLCAVMVCSWLIVAKGQRFMPVLTNYGPAQYDGGLQNWSITQDHRGVMHVGNNRGMLSFDGYTWTQTPLPNNTLVRSVMADGDRVYAGSYEEFGFFQRDGFGAWKYTSLWKQLKGYKPHHDEIWKIFKLRNGNVIFQSFCSWFLYDGKKVTAHYNPKTLPLFFFNCRGTIFAQMIGHGIYKVEGDRLLPVTSRQDVGNDDVVAMLAWGDKTVLCTVSHGLFLLDGDKAQLFRTGNVVRPFHTDIDDKLLTSGINRATVTRDGSAIVIGTILNGIMAIGKSGEELWSYNTKSMLRNNTVLDVFSDKDNNVWAALDNGIALIRQGSGSLALLRCPFGMVYDVYDGPNGLIMATNQNALLYNGHGFNPIPGTHGQNWHVSRFGNDLIVGNNHGPQLLRGLSSKPLVDNITASSTSICRHMVNEDNDYLVESSYTDIRVYKHVGDSWQFLTTVKDFCAPVRQLEVDSHGTIWAANMSKGFYRIEMSGDMKRALRIDYFPVVPKSSNGAFFHVMKIDGEVVLAQGRHLYRAEAGMTRMTALERQIGADVVAASTVDNHRFWLSTIKGYELYSIAEKSGKRSYKKILDVPAAFFGLDCSDNLNTVKVFGRYAYFCMNEGVGRMDMATVSAKSKASANNKLWLDRAWCVSPSHGETVVDISKDKPKVDGDLTVRFNYANYNDVAMRFTFVLEGGGLLATSHSDKPIVHYGNLPYGSYELRCEARDALGKLIDSKTFQFQHPTPWWGTIPMILLYCVALGLVAYYVARWKERRTIRRQMMEMEEERLRKDLELSEKQRIIETQQKQLLERQLQDKGKEIASMALQGIMDKKGRTSETWKLYQENFDLIHKQFFRHLREKFPILTATDLKFCAYLRLNLNTKEIAELTGLSVRGVEGARYRLRKKLLLKENDDLVAFLVDFK